jgi:hypothetical protein
VARPLYVVAVSNPVTDDRDEMGVCIEPAECVVACARLTIGCSDPARGPNQTSPIAIS